MHRIFTQQQPLRVPVCACSTFSACSKRMGRHRKEWEKQKGPLTPPFLQKQHNVRPSVWAPLLSSCHQRPKFILPMPITEEPTSKSQRATDPEWRPCSGILRTSSASSECCPVITGERKRRHNITQSIFVISSYSCSFFFSLPFQILSIASVNSLRQTFPHKMSGQVVLLISKDRRTQIQSCCNFTDFTGVTGHCRWIVSVYRHSF